ncbi:hypothetical protein CC85DRAFT_298792 [Cutaneotrichosporon oleaginosum]|uniref:Uncharacterized protein n=1 Tax=Cutaneotrichosporon oleaginosum TaxID=879819 RepID=A0A0J0XYH7_9TREE|nr:uncharacterized protein CC85DRAFT_298792 [Cutaneotrichosporon oleaginosum]KLT46091.1 hypothetical protein CC85DRAFT_298792 [Cutaneotrichosporon oleaginosum]TXT10104.1 hypothetical protein COLE_04038 [Cutaneotrichosporon oleaginosum]
MSVRARLLLRPALRLMPARLALAQPPLQSNQHFLTCSPLHASSVSRLPRKSPLDTGHKDLLAHGEVQMKTAIQPFDSWRMMAAKVFGIAGAYVFLAGLAAGVCYVGVVLWP